MVLWSGHFVCHPVCRITAKVIRWFHWNLVLRWLGLQITSASGGDSVPDMNSGSFFHFPHHCGIGDFRRLISISYSHWSIFMTVVQVIATDKIMNPRHFWSNPTNIRIQIQINSKIWIQILNHFWLRLDALVEVYCLWTQPSWYLHPSSYATSSTSQKLLQ